MGEEQGRRNFVLEGVARHIIEPFQRFFRKTATGSLLLVLATVAALLAANSSLGQGYHHLWETPLRVSINSIAVEKTLHEWINDGLMVVFFFLVGLEIKREVLSGDLSTFSNAILPVAAALGGMAVPALVYTFFNAGAPGEPGWGIPMATDIAFALGVLALLKKRVPQSLIVFLTAVAIVDDLGSILVIALFYTENISLAPLAWALAFVLFSYALNWVGVRMTLPYVLIGVCIWFLLLRSGVHSTVAGVLLAMTIPATRKIRHAEFVKSVRDQLYLMTGERDEANYCPIKMDDEAQQAVIVALEDACHDAEAPLQHIEHHLHPWVSYLILPLFAFANAGIVIDPASLAAAVMKPVTIGAALGLFLGKQLGIFSFCWLAVRSGLSRLPDGVGWMHVYGVSVLGGIGFTMSLFITALAFRSEALIEEAKLGIFIASILSGVLGYVLIRKASLPGLSPQTPPRRGP